jgi:hypothetical protein
MEGAVQGAVVTTSTPTRNCERDKRPSLLTAIDVYWENTRQTFREQHRWFETVPDAPISGYELKVRSGFEDLLRTCARTVGR